MENSRDLSSPATEYHQALPGRIRGYLNDRGIPDLLIDAHLLGWDGRRITIPVFNRDGELAFFKLACDPEDKDGPKMITTPGTYAELYGWDQLLKKPSQIIICEGEFDRLVLEAQGFIAVTSTAGAGVFRAAWAEDFEAIPEVYVCFDNDNAGRWGAGRVGRLISRARLVELPEEVGPGGDVTDFFVRLGKSREDFEELMGRALPAPPEPPSPPPASRQYAPRRESADPELRERIERIKRDIPIAEVVARYLPLHGSGERLAGFCLFHPDRDPSLVVFPATGTFHCFGCGKHGDVITFIRTIEQLGFLDTLHRLEQHARRIQSA